MFFHRIELSLVQPGRAYFCTTSLGVAGDINPLFLAFNWLTITFSHFIIYPLLLANYYNRPLL